MSEIDPFLAGVAGRDVAGRDVAESAVLAAPRRRRAAGAVSVQISLRVPASWVGQLRERAIAAAWAEDCMVTPQEIVRRIIADALRRPF